MQATPATRTAGLLLAVVAVAAPGLDQARAAKGSATPPGGAGRLVKLQLHAAKAPQPKNKYRLLPGPGDRKPGNAAELYRAAVQSLGNVPMPADLGPWLSGPVKQLPRSKVRAALAKAKDPLAKAEQAARRKGCNWAALPDGGDSVLGMASLAKCRSLAKLVVLQARLEIAEGRHDKAIHHLLTAFSLARDISNETELIQGLVGVAIASLAARQLEELVQAPSAPNLYWALADLPSPLVDLSKQMQLELDNLKKDPRSRGNPAVQAMLQSQLKSTHDRVRLLMAKLDRQIAAPRCIEAIRLYAANHDGKPPAALNEITEVPVPDDPATGKSFKYAVTRGKGILELPAPKGLPPEDGTRYELTFEK